LIGFKTDKVPSADCVFKEEPVSCRHDTYVDTGKDAYECGTMRTGTFCQDGTTGCDKECIKNCKTRANFDGKAFTTSSKICPEMNYEKEYCFAFQSCAVKDGVKNNPEGFLKDTKREACQEKCDASPTCIGIEMNGCLNDPGDGSPRSFPPCENCFLLEDEAGVGLPLRPGGDEKCEIDKPGDVLVFEKPAVKSCRKEGVCKEPAKEVADDGKVQVMCPEGYRKNFHSECTGTQKVAAAVGDLVDGATAMKDSLVAGVGAMVNMVTGGQQKVGQQVTAAQQKVGQQVTQQVAVQQKVQQQKP
jgi:hypothetical protein